jgi:hypothetical protein
MFFANFFVFHLKFGFTERTFHVSCGLSQPDASDTICSSGEAEAALLRST